MAQVLQVRGPSDYHLELLQPRAYHIISQQKHYKQHLMVGIPSSLIYSSLSLSLVTNIYITKTQPCPQSMLLATSQYHAPVVVRIQSGAMATSIVLHSTNL